jgi:hypothetical protein
MRTHALSLSLSLSVCVCVCVCVCVREREREREHMCMHSYAGVLVHPLPVQLPIAQVINLCINFMTLEAITIALFSYNHYSVLTI